MKRIVPILTASLLALSMPLVALQAQTGEAATSSREGRPVIGLGFWTVDGGIEINSVSAGSAAQKAGLKVGMLVTHVNGTPLAGMGITEVEGMVGALEGEITFTTRELGEVKLRKAPIERNAG